MGVPRVFLAKSAQPFEKREVGAKFQFARVRKQLKRKKLDFAGGEWIARNQRPAGLQRHGRADERQT